MQGTNNYIPEPNHVSMVRSVEAVLYLQFMLHVMLFRTWNMFYTFTLATNRKVAGSIPDGVGIFHWHNPSDRTMALGSSQPLTEMSTRSTSWG